MTEYKNTGDLEGGGGGGGADFVSYCLINFPLVPFLNGALCLYYLPKTPTFCQLQRSLWSSTCSECIHVDIPSVSVFLCKSFHFEWLVEVFFFVFF